MLFGTTEKYHPSYGRDTMVQHGLTIQIYTRHHCITAMKIYQDKSLEELRLEDRRCIYNSKSLEELRMEDYLSGMDDGFWSLPFQSDIRQFGHNVSTFHGFYARFGTVYDALSEAKKVFEFKAPNFWGICEKNTFQFEKKKSPIMTSGGRRIRHARRPSSLSNKWSTTERRETTMPIFRMPFATPVSSNVGFTYKNGEVFWRGPAFEEPERMSVSPGVAGNSVAEKFEIPTLMFGSTVQRNRFGTPMVSTTQVFTSLQNVSSASFGTVVSSGSDFFGGFASSQNSEPFGSISSSSIFGSPVPTSQVFTSQQNTNKPFGNAVSSPSSTHFAGVASATNSAPFGIVTSATSSAPFGIVTSASTSAPFGLVASASSKPFGIVTSATTSAPFGLVASASSKPFGIVTSASSSTPFGLVSSASFKPFGTVTSATSSAPFGFVSSASSKPFGIVTSATSSTPFGFVSSASSKPFGIVASATSSAPFGLVSSISSKPFGIVTSATSSAPFGLVSSTSSKSFGIVTSATSSEPFGLVSSTSSKPFDIVTSATSSALFGLVASASSKPFGIVTSATSSAPFGLVSSASSKPFGIVTSSPRSMPFGVVFSSPNSPRVAATQTLSTPICTDPTKMDTTEFVKNQNPHPMVFKKFDLTFNTSTSDCESPAPTVAMDVKSVGSDPLSDVKKFILSYEERYGKKHPIFYQGTYGQALSEAKQNLIFLLVYLHNDEAQDIDFWCRNTLGSSDVMRYINNHTLFWACNVQSDEGTRVAKVLKTGTCPFMNVIVVKDYKTLLGFPVKGLPSSSELINQLQRIIGKNAIVLIRAHQNRIKPSAAQSSLEKLDEEFEESLLRVQERNRKAEEQAKVKKELDANNMNIQQLLDSIRFEAEVSVRKLPLELESSNRESTVEPSKSEPSREENHQGCGKSLLKDRKMVRKTDKKLSCREECESRVKEELTPENMKIQIIQLQKELAAKKVPTEPEPTAELVYHVKTNLGKRVLTRRFLISDTTEDLYHWIFSQPEAPANFEIITRYPKKTLYPTDQILSLREAGIAEREVVHVNKLHDTL